MVINRSIIPKSSFLSVEKDMNIIINRFMSNERLKRLLYYTTPDAISQPNLTDEQSIALVGKNIKNIPKLYIDGSVLNYIVLSFDNFTPNVSNPEYRNNIVEIDIICHLGQWQLEDFQLRPYRIAAEIDSLLDKQKLTGIGLLQFIGCSQIVLTDEYAGLCLMYEAIHGDEDKKPMANPSDQDKFEEDFKQMIKNLNEQ